MASSAVPDGERRAAPGADEQSRVAGEDDREREGAFQLRERRGRRGLRVEAALHVGIDQVRDDLGVGVGGELAPLGLQLGAQVAVVLDDAVVDHGDAPVACGWALVSLGSPCVAQRVWPMPVVPRTGFRATRRSSSASLPSARRNSIEPLARVASPAES